VVGLLEAIPHFRDTDPDPAYVELLEVSLAAVRARDNAAANITKVMVMDQLEKPRDTFVLAKGNYEAKTEVRVEGHVPEIFQRRSAAGTAQAARLNRLDLARWLVSPENPLAARTAVNRAWQAFFGTGFVKTAEDFGVQSERPSSPNYSTGSRPNTSPPAGIPENSTASSSPARPTASRRGSQPNSTNAIPTIVSSPEVRAIGCLLG